jgi:Flp pilus assembly protein TadD
VRAPLAVAVVLAAVAVVLGAGCNADGARHKAAGNVLFKRGDLEGAAREYHAALALDARDANAHTLLGNVEFERDRLEAADTEYRAALALDAHARAALQGLATVALRRGRPAEAATAWRTLLESEPRDPETHVALGKLAWAEGDLDGAERHLREALTWAQNDSAALYLLGLVLAKHHEQEQANAVFDRLERLAPDKAYAPYGRAVAAAVGGRDDEALKWLGVALGRGIDDVAGVERDASFARLRDDPRFTSLIAATRTRAPPRKGPGP